MCDGVTVRGAGARGAIVKDPRTVARRTLPRFLVNTASEQAASAPIAVVVNWTAGLKP